MEAGPATPPTSDPIIEVTDLVKEYRSGDGCLVRAVAGLSLAVDAGEIVGLLGANGAGKTTTLRIIATLLKPTAGTARVCGHDSVADPVGVRRSLGYVSATTGVPDRLTARELLTSFGRLNGLTDTEVNIGMAVLVRRAHDRFQRWSSFAGCCCCGLKRCWSAGC